MPLDLTQIKAICFDIDGTLADTGDRMVEKTARFLSPLLFAFPPRTRLNYARKLIMAIETPANTLWHLFDRIGLDDWFFRLRLKFLPQKIREKPLWKPIHGVRETLIELSKQYSLTIISVRDAYLIQ